MNAALERYSDNPIIDELVAWPPRPVRMRSVRAANVLFRQPFIEITFDNGETIQRHFPRAGFAEDWAEARVILETLTSAELISDFTLEPYADAGRLANEVLAVRDECMAECEAMFRAGLYEQFLIQYGPDCRNLPFATERMLAQARRELGSRA